MMYEKNVWNKYSNRKEIDEFADEYKFFLDNSKTERMGIKFKKKRF